MLTKEQVAERVNYLGGTDAAAVMGLSRYNTPMGVWAEKTGKIVRPNKDGELPIRVGNELEDLVAKLFVEESRREEKVDRKVQRVREIQRHPTHDFIRVQLDRHVVTEQVPLECKTASAFKQGEWDGADVPTEYIIQVMTQLLVLRRIAEAAGKEGPAYGYLACLIGGNVDFVYKRIDWDEAMGQEIEDRLVKFWRENVQGGAMPDPTDDDDGTIKLLFPVSKTDETEAHQLPDDTADLLERIDEIGTETRGEIGTLTKELKELRNEVKVRMAEHPRGVVGTYEVTFKERSFGVKLDQAKLLADHPGFIVRYGKETVTRVLSFKNVAAKKGAK